MRFPKPDRGVWPLHGKGATHRLAGLIITPGKGHRLRRIPQFKHKFQPLHHLGNAFGLIGIPRQAIRHMLALLIAHIRIIDQTTAGDLVHGRDHFSHQAGVSEGVRLVQQSQSHSTGRASQCRHHTPTLKNRIVLSQH